MYKILYLPLGEDVLIACRHRKKYIRFNDSPYESLTGLCCPSSVIKESSHPKDKGKYKTALFEDKTTALSWVHELVYRDCLYEDGLKMVHFEIVPIH